MKLTLMTSIALLLTAVDAHAFDAVAAVVCVEPINETWSEPCSHLLR